MQALTGLLSDLSASQLASLAAAAGLDVYAAPAAAAAAAGASGGGALASNSAGDDPDAEDWPTSAAGLTSTGKNLSSRYRGVCWNKKNKRWQAAINSSGKYLYLGSFQAEAEAARAFDRAAIKIRGAKAKLNFEHADYFDAHGNLIEEASPAGNADISSGTPAARASGGAAAAATAAAAAMAAGDGAGDDGSSPIRSKNRRKSGGRRRSSRGPFQSSSDGGGGDGASAAGAGSTDTATAAAGLGALGAAPAAAGLVPAELLDEAARLLAAPPPGGLGWPGQGAAAGVDAAALMSMLGGPAGGSHALGAADADCAAGLHELLRALLPPHCALHGTAPGPDAGMLGLVYSDPRSGRFGCGLWPVGCASMHSFGLLFADAGAARACLHAAVQLLLQDRGSRGGGSSGSAVQQAPQQQQRQQQQQPLSGSSNGAVAARFGSAGSGLGSLAGLGAAQAAQLVQQAAPQGEQPPLSLGLGLLGDLSISQLQAQLAGQLVEQQAQQTQQQPAPKKARTAGVALSDLSLQDALRAIRGSQDAGHKPS